MFEMRPACGGTRHAYPWGRSILCLADRPCMCVLAAGIQHVPAGTQHVRVPAGTQHVRIAPSASAFAVGTQHDCAGGHTAQLSYRSSLQVRDPWGHSMFELAGRHLPAGTQHD